MTISLTIEVPDTLGQQLQEMHDRLPEILARGLRDVLAEQTAHHQDEVQIVVVLPTIWLARMESMMERFTPYAPHTPPPSPATPRGSPAPQPAPRATPESHQRCKQNFGGGK